MESDNGTGLEKAVKEDIQEAEERADVEYLLEALSNGSRDLRVLAARALGRVGGSRAKTALVSVARDRRGQGPDVRIASIEALGLLYGEEDYVSFLEEFITGDNRRVVTGARAVLMEVDPERYPLHLLSRGCLDHRAIGVYGKNRISESVPLLGGFLEERVAEGDFLGTNYWGKVYASVKALGNIGGEEAVKYLRALQSAIPGTGSLGGRALVSERARKIGAAVDNAIGIPGKG